MNKNNVFAKKVSPLWGLLTLFLTSILAAIIILQKVHGLVKIMTPSL